MHSLQYSIVKVNQNTAIQCLNYTFNNVFLNIEMS